MIEQIYEKKRIGFARNHARNLLERFKSAKVPKIEYEVPIIDIAKYLGFHIENLNSMADHHSAIIYPDNMLIGLNKNHHEHRQRFSLGHELGHYLLKHPPEFELPLEEIKICNREADEFSGELLVPLESLKRSLNHTKSISDLTHLFNVSQEVITIRLLNQNLLKKI
ncbi:MAG: ImmA/IrrE family metallo-endopeptidase [Deltaproteobacteria bacterium]|nr:ImmA/IrrE family metallo-endopeptidase [Deltaproteobacteria bacterium]